MRIACVLVAVACVAGSLAGCSGVILSAEYSAKLDQTAALAGGFASDAEAGRMDANDMARCLRYNATAWELFQDARDGRSSEDDR